mmetsp:Transcript_26297/g.77748  ORF Transcript_26297/g.77748 Transcript_26297/m.77748 type:complete len:86 (-) Transcript_26297:152-409(-)
MRISMGKRRRSGGRSEAEAEEETIVADRCEAARPGGGANLLRGSQDGRSDAKERKWKKSVSFLMHRNASPTDQEFNDWGEIISAR